MFLPEDHAHMSYALQLAEKGLYSTSPNPRVGCVVVRNGVVVGSGWHVQAGQPHAEINALNIAGGLAKGATVYLTLEPCSHYGRTAPCVHALVSAGVIKVIIAMEDPNPLVSGQGCAILQQAGIDVQIGLMAEQAQILNIGFVMRMKHHKPWIRLKTAVSLDGGTALNNGASQWITGESARRDGHQWRARSCAVITGSGTLTQDNPQLTVRHIQTPRQPKRMLIDSSLVVSVDAKLLQGGDVFIFTTSHDKNKIQVLRERGIQVIVLSKMERGIDLKELMSALTELEINELMVEAGSKLSGAFIQAELVDELIIYFAPNLIGHLSKRMFDFPELTQLTQKKQLKIRDLRLLGEDIRVIANFH